MSSKKAFRPLLSYDFQVCVTEMAISLIVEIFDLQVKLWSYWQKQTVWPFLNASLQIKNPQ